MASERKCICLTGILAWFSFLFSCLAPPTRFLSRPLSWLPDGHCFSPGALCPFPFFENSWSCPFARSFPMHMASQTQDSGSAARVFQRGRVHQWLESILSCLLSALITLSAQGADSPDQKGISQALSLIENRVSVEVEGSGGRAAGVCPLG